MNSMKLSKIGPAVGLLWIAMFPSFLSAQLTADFSLNTSSFFSGNAQARAAVQAALADLDAALNQNLSPITAGNQTVTGTSGSASIDIAVTGRVRNPATGALTNVSAVSGQSVVRIFVGARPGVANQLGQPVLGEGGPTAWSFSLTGSAVNVSDVGPALNNAANALSSIYLRGEGPRVFTFNGDVNFAGQNFPIVLTFGQGPGSVVINSNTPNFHFDHTTLPPAGTIDLYSVVLHEAMHAVGLGPSDEWDLLVQGTSWTGAEVVGLLGSGSAVIANGVLAPDEDHVAQEVLSRTITDGRMQRSALVPIIPAGVRLRLTELDLAFMRDLGYPNAVVPPRESLLGDFDLDGDVDLADLDQYNSNIGSQAVGSLGLLDLDGDLDVDATDLETHYTTLVQTSNGITGALAGDVNLDGSVDVLSDAFVLVSNLGSPVSSWSQGDFNGDGTVDVLGDAFLLVANLNMSNE